MLLLFTGILASPQGKMALTLGEVWQALWECTVRNMLFYTTINITFLGGSPTSWD
jgi:hypothetical protein